MATTLVTAAYLASLATGMELNLSEMRQTGRRAQGWIQEVAQSTVSLPDGDWLIVTATGGADNRVDYSLYRQTTPQNLMLPEAIRYAVRERLEVVPEEDADEPGWRDRLHEAALQGRAHCVTLEDGKVEISPLGSSYLHASPCARRGEET